MSKPLHLFRPVQPVPTVVQKLIRQKGTGKIQYSFLLEPLTKGGDLACYLKFNVHLTKFGIIFEPLINYDTIKTDFDLSSPTVKALKGAIKIAIGQAIETSQAAAAGASSQSEKNRRDSLELVKQFNEVFYIPHKKVYSIALNTPFLQCARLVFNLQKIDLPLLVPNIVNGREDNSFIGHFKETGERFIELQRELQYPSKSSLLKAESLSKLAGFININIIAFVAVVFGLLLFFKL
jgi:hypothetical protein